jgi:hypothetical protein
MFLVLVFCSMLCLYRSLIPPSQITNQSNTLIGLPSLATVWTLALSILHSLWNPVWAFPSIGSTFAITNSKFSAYPISILSHILPYRTVTQTCFGKTVITFAYELGLSYFFWNWVESNFASNQLGLPMGRGPNLASKAPNLEPGWCFNFHAKIFGISIGHTFCPIELKIGVLPT